MANDGDVERVALARDSRQALDDLFSATYSELRRLAAAVSRSDRHATINPTLLVTEAWLKLAGSPPAGVVSRLHFKRIAARAMRQVLVEAARRRRARKRGDGAVPIALEDVALPVSGDPEQLLALDEALDRLERLSARQAAIVETRFFGGLEAAETAELLNVSEATVLRDWRAARAWLAGELRESS
jgi:RNA polymerase sigma factor (TIGR02999 family)